MRKFQCLSFGLLVAASALTVGCSAIPIPGVAASAPTIFPTVALLPTETPKVAVAVPTATLALIPTTQGDAAQVVAQFFQAVSAGDVDKAMTFWSLYEPDQPADYATNMRNIVSTWASGNHQFTVGDFTYSGLVAPGDYQTLTKDDSRVSRASVNVQVDGANYTLRLVLAKGGWLIQGITTP
jgi:hypothetical protein